MKAFLFAIALAASSAYAQFTVNTPPSAVVCQPLLISWSGGTAPYFLSILPGNQPGAAALVDFGNVGENQTQTWNVTLPAGTSIGINVRDSAGALAQSAPFSIIAGSDTSCLNATTTSSGSTTSRTTTGSSTTSRTVTTTSTSTTPTTTATTPRPTTTTPGTTTTAPATTTSGGAAPLNTNAASKLSQVGFAGIVGAIAAALLV